MKKSVLYNLSKVGIFIIIFGLTVFGIIGSFSSSFNMANYCMFLEKFTFVLGPFVLAIAGGGAWKNFLTKRYDKKQGE